MPYALMHGATGTLLSRMQVNGYGLSYYGILLWEDAPDSDQVKAALQAAGLAPDDPASGRPEAWEALKLTEHEAKMANVKLRNDPRRVAVYRNGVVEASAARE